MTEPQEQRAVIAPEALIRSFFDGEHRSVLEYWRAGRIRLVVTRSLLKRYLTLLVNMGVGQDLLRRWIAWFTSPEKAVYLPEADSEGGSDAALCLEAARWGQARWIVPGEKAGGRGKGGKIRWVTPAGFQSDAESEM
jgi:hypothetical protein